MSRTPRTSALVAVVVPAVVAAVLATIVAALLALILPAPAAGATAQHAAGLVVDTGDRVVTVYVEFSEDTITGEELLRRADVDAVFSDEYGMGQAVCSILGVGSPRDDCFREAEENGRYWNYSRAEGGAWQRSSRGVSNTTVEHGDVDGWAWGNQGSQPPYHSFEEIRAQHAPEPDPSPTPTTEPPSSEEEPDTQAPTSEPAQEASPAGQAVTSPSAAEDPTVTSPSTPSASPSPTATATRAVTTTPSPGPDDRTSASAEPVVATAEQPDPGRGLWSLVTFVAVMAILIAAIVWRRRDRSGTRSDTTGRTSRP